MIKFRWSKKKAAEARARFMASAKAARDAGDTAAAVKWEDAASDALRVMEARHTRPGNPDMGKMRDAKKRRVVT